MEFGRLITAMVTPFNDNGQIDWEQVGPLMDYLIEEQKSDSLVICGTTGESPTLTDDEKLKQWEKTVELANGRCKIIAGTGSNSTAHTIHLSQEAQKRGVDALLLVAPYYNRPSQEGLYQHFKAVAESVNIPVVLYNVPSRSVVNIDVDTTIRLSQIPNIVATKDCAGVEQLTNIVSGSAEGFRVYTGDDTMTLPALSIGCHGVVSVASHVIGKQMKEMITAYLGGNIIEAAKLHGQCQPVFTGIFKYPSPGPVKHLLNLKGIPVGGVRLPLIALNEQEGDYIASLLS
ncbi:4-hydroxy-tetrahydrodipicolinate synthase [Paenibacillus sp. N1-5-1-14]|uniref:4-hydroxy-tetrahydrodipicolinate synthase n=1 Tax=Paenibacillus radicibacter TaxID=2972488 RepID=UPI00215977AD|nr:4-hydroxy-tetrahydrodipicolinate synthase [Paenibacillus radicibacter]MCR8642133.1 4-hydroxy-tetrahydrodipicolinate synthase [Paenibacillus radicibacter]